MSIGERKAVEIGQKIQSLARELDDWRDRSKAGEPFEKHNSQIRRVTLALDGFLATINTNLEAVAGDPVALLKKCRELERNVLEAHRLWDFFRSKLAQRAIPHFCPYLFGADEFAWACYEAAQMKADKSLVEPEKVKEPPLVFFHAGTSPLATSRHRTIDAGQPSGNDVALRSQEALGVSSDLPIPVVGIPWFQVQHFPDVLVIGHEVGHLVEDDFGLTKTIESLLTAGLDRAKVPPARQSAWHSWLGEIFADVYGTLATGPAFVGSLADFLARGPDRIAAQRFTAADWGAYPTDYLRVLLALAVLAHLKFKDERDERMKDWSDTYNKHNMAEFVADLPAVVEALVDGQYPAFQNATLKDVLSFSRPQHDLAESQAELLVNKIDLESDDVRVLFAAARLAYEQKPVEFVDDAIPHRVLKRVQNRVGVRAELLQKDKDRLALQDAIDRKVGSTLYKCYVDD